MGSSHESCEGVQNSNDTVQKGRWLEGTGLALVNARLNMMENSVSVAAHSDMPTDATVSLFLLYKAVAAKCLRDRASRK